MDINNEIYIYYVNENSKNNIKLRDHIKLLENCEKEKNKKKLIKNFRKKFFRDFIKSSKKLIKDKNLYPALIILLSGIDVLAKHYNGNITTRDIGENYKIFMNEIMKIKENISEKIYRDFRCCLIHSGSTPISFTLSKNIERIDDDGEKIVINLNYFFEKVKEGFEYYLEIIEKNKIDFDNFLKVQKKLYK